MPLSSGMFKVYYVIWDFITLNVIMQLQTKRTTIIIIDLGNEGKIILLKILNNLVEYRPDISVNIIKILIILL